MSSIKSGVWPTMVTPYTAENRVDYNGIEHMLRFYAERGVDGVFAVCQSSEMFHLSLAERAELLRFIVGHAPKSLQIIASGHVSDSVEEQLRDAYAIMCQGAAAYVVLPNRFAAAEEPDDKLLRRLEQFVKGFDTAPLGMYECPYPYKRLLTPAVLRWCIESGRFHFIKDTCCNLEQIREKLSLIQGTGLKLFNANSSTLLESLRMGADGFSGVMANFHPEFYVWLCHHFREEPDRAERVQNYIGAASMAEYQYYPVNAKYSMALQGVPIGLHSRARDAAGFSQSQRLEIEQFNQMSILAGAAFGINQLL